MRKKGTLRQRVGTGNVRGLGPLGFWGSAFLVIAYIGFFGMTKAYTFEQDATTLEDIEMKPAQKDTHLMASDFAMEKSHPARLETATFALG